MPLIETYRGVVFPWLTDQMGHLTTSRYVEMFDVAAYHLAHRLGLGDQDDGFGLADVRHETDFQAEVRLGGLVLIRSGIVSIGRSSFRARHIMTDPDLNIIHATMETVSVRFDLTARKAAALPATFSERAAALTLNP